MGMVLWDEVAEREKENLKMTSIRNFYLSLIDTQRDLHPLFRVPVQCGKRNDQMLTDYRS